MLSGKELLAMSQMDITEIDPDALVDVNAVTIDNALTHKEKMLSYLEQIGNPYCFKSGDVPVRVRFLDKDHPVSESLIRYFSRLKQK